MQAVKKDWLEDEIEYKGYKWSVQAEYGTISIEEEELFNRIEFQHISEHEHKVAYAMDLGWRYNVDNQMWYRIKGH